MNIPPGRVDRRTAAAGAAAFFSILHAFPIERVVELGLPRSVPWLPERSVKMAADLMKCAGNVSARIRDACLDFLESSAPTLEPEDKRLIHSDFSAEHILIDPGTGRIMGVIDWTDAGVGDPAGDLVGVWAWLGEENLDALLRGYSLPLDDDAPRRIRFKGTRLLIGQLVYGILTAKEPYARHAVERLEEIFRR